MRKERKQIERERGRGSGGMQRGQGSKRRFKGREMMTYNKKRGQREVAKQTKREIGKEEKGLKERGKDCARET